MNCVDQLVDLAEVVRHLAERLQGGLKAAGERVQDLGGVLADADALFGVPIRSSAAAMAASAAVIAAALRPWQPSQSFLVGMAYAAARSCRAAFWSCWAQSRSLCATSSAATTCS